MDVPPDSYLLHAHHDEPPDPDFWGGKIIVFPGASAFPYRRTLSRTAASGSSRYAPTGAGGT